MPKNAEDKLYLNPAIPKSTRLAECLEDGSTRSGITKSQLLVWFATEYVRIVIDGGSVTPTAPVAPAVVSTTPTLSEGKQEPDGTAQGGIRTLASMTTGDDTNYDSVFGDPD